MEQIKSAILAGNVTAMIEKTISLSLARNASDIHIEPGKTVTRIRMRVDGILHVIVEYPLNLHAGVVSKLKIMADLKIDESRIPQDGRISTYIDETEVELRTSTLPTVHGEKVVMRVLDKSKTVPDLPVLGITGRNLARIEEALAQPNGIILTSGPTGSGKTTTLYSALARLNSADRNIMTFEDPIENQMEGLSQSQVKPRIGYTFADGLRTALRQDPDIIMVGEIRDRETIDVAIEASLTGHLVLSTIHTNSAVETISRILNMGVPDFLVTSSINLIIAQRLGRRIDPDHAVPMEISPNAADKMRAAFEVFEPYDGFDQGLFQNPQLVEPDPNVPDTDAYKGRVGIYEVLIMTEPIKKAILAGMPMYEIAKVAQAEGMITLEQDGIIKALQGKTTLSEVYKLVKE